MSLAFKCDRCGKLFSPESKMVNKIKTGIYGLTMNTLDPMKRQEQNFDLCDSCYRRLKSFLENYDNVYEEKEDNKNENKNKTVD